MQQLRYGPRAWPARSAIDDDIHEDREILLLDSCLHVAAAAFLSEGALSKDYFYLPASFKRVELSPALGSRARADGLRRQGRAPQATATRSPPSLVLVNGSGKVLARVEFVSRRVPRSKFLASLRRRSASRTGFSTSPGRSRRGAQRQGPSLAAGCWLVLCDSAGVGEATARRLRDAGAACYTVRPGNAFEQSGTEFRIDPRQPRPTTRPC